MRSREGHGWELQDATWRVRINRIPSSGFVMAGGLQSSDIQEIALFCAPQGAVSLSLPHAVHVSSVSVLSVHQSLKTCKWSGFRAKTPPMRATCHTHLILCHLMTLLIIGEQHKP